MTSILETIELVLHMPGGKDHDQSLHGRRFHDRRFQGAKVSEQSLVVRDLDGKAAEYDN